MALTRASTPSCRRPDLVRPLGQVLLSLLEQDSEPCHPRRRGDPRAVPTPSPAGAGFAPGAPVEPDRSRLRIARRFEPNLGHPVVGNRRPAKRRLRSLGERPVSTGGVSVRIRQFRTNPEPADRRRVLVIQGLQMPADFGNVRSASLERLGRQHVMGVEIVGLDVQEVLGPVDGIAGQVLAPWRP